MTQLLQASLITSVALFLYWAFLEKETHYRLNRWVLLSCMALACILPTLSIQMEMPALPQFDHAQEMPSQPTVIEDSHIEESSISPEYLSQSDIEVVPEGEDSHLATSFSLYQWISEIPLSTWMYSFYLLGVFCLLTHFLVQLLSLIQHIHSLPKSQLGKYTLVKLPQGHASYSFFHYIFINPQKLDSGTYQQVLSHERIHVDQNHSIDIILSHLLLISQWFNPFAWIYRRKIIQNLEYLTDDMMVKKGNDKTAYQVSLLRISAPSQAAQLVLNYSQSLLKKRILMMNTERSSFRSLWKYALLLPLFILGSLMLIAEKVTAPQEVIPIVEQLPVPVQIVNTLQEDVSTPEVQEAPATQQLPTVSVSHVINLSEDIQGTWEGKLKEEELCLRIIRSISEDDWNWMSYNCYPQSNFTPTVTSLVSEFSLKKEPGEIRFTGSFKENKGEGTFTFSGSDAYRKQLKEQGIKQVSENLLFRLFFTQKRNKYVANLLDIQELGLDDETTRILSEEGIPADLAKSYQDANLPVAKNIRFLRSRVRPDLLLSYEKAGLSLETYKDFINSRVPATLLQGYIEAGLSVTEHKPFINGRVKPELLEDYKKAGLSLEKNRSFIQSRVKPSLLKAYEDAGLSLEDNREFIQSRVKPDLLKDYQEAGYKLDEYTSYIQSRIKPELLKSYENAGLDLKENRSFIQSRVRPELINAYHEAGFNPQSYTSFLQSRVPVDILKEYKEAGFDLGKYNSYIQSRVPANLLIAYKNAGLSLEEHRSLIQSRTKPELIKAYQDAGLDIKSNMAYIQSRVKPDLLMAYQEAGMDHKEHHDYIMSRIKPEYLQSFKNAGYSLEEVKPFIRSRVKAENLTAYKQAGFDPHEYKEFLMKRVRASFLQKYKAAGLDIEDHKDFIFKRMDPEKVKKYRESQLKKN